jgi:hypothetical protein
MKLTNALMAGATLALLPVLAACQADRSAGTGPYAKEVATAIPEIEKSVGLKFKTPPKVESKSKDEVRAFLEKKFDEDLPALELAGAEKSYKLLGLIPDTLDLRKFMLRLLTEQVAGYYDPETKVLYVVGTEGTGPGAVTPEMIAVTITHELVHALQDQYFPLDSLEKEHGDNDRASAVQAVVEGEAVYEQMSAMLGGNTVAMALPGGWDRVRQMIRDAQGTMPVFATAPMFIQETLLFPYLSGAEFRSDPRLRPPSRCSTPTGSSIHSTCRRASCSRNRRAVRSSMRTTWVRSKPGSTCSSTWATRESPPAARRVGRGTTTKSSRRRRARALPGSPSGIRRLMPRSSAT